MWAPAFQFGLPLLARELVEQAMRRRTYIFRITYAVLLFGIAYCMFYDLLRGANAFSAMGRGRQMFNQLAWLQFIGIYVFMPALGATSIAVEKERSTFGLLLLTRLSPWTIVLEKLLSRMVPMVTFLLLGLPLLGFTYTLGGFQMSEFAFCAIALGVALLQTASLAVFCSAYCRTSTGALISTYLLQGLLMFGPPVLMGMCMGREWHRVGWVFCAPMLRELAAAGGLGIAVFALIPLLGVTLITLVAARIVLVPRAFAVPKHRLQKLFRRMDGTFARWNDNRYTRGVILIRDAESLPGSRPIAWVETTRTVLGSLRYLVRMLLVVETALAMLLLFIALLPNDAHEFISMIVFVAWIGAIALVAVKGASLIAAERSRQTLDVLLTLPISARELLAQKLSGIHRLMGVLAVPMVTLFLFDAWWRNGHPTTNQWDNARYLNPPLYLTSSLTNLVIYLNLTAWISIFVGLRSRSQTRAVLMSLGAVVALCIAPLLMLFVFIVTFQLREQEPFTWLLFTSPMMSVVFNEFNAFREVCKSPWMAVVLNGVYYGTWWAVLRAWCLRKAPAWLGRTRELPADDDLTRERILEKRLQPAGEEI